MDEVRTATLSTEGNEQVVRLPDRLRLPSRALHVTRVGDGLLRPVDLDVHDWWADLNAYRGAPFVENGRQQPPMLDVDDMPLDR